MRIVSSDGSIDVPYENATLFVDSKGNIKYILSRDKEFALLLHEYKDRDRGLGVMKSIRDAYAMGRKVFILPEE